MITGSGFRCNFSMVLLLQWRLLIVIVANVVTQLYDHMSSFFQRPFGIITASNANVITFLIILRYVLITKCTYGLNLKLLPCSASSASSSCLCTSCSGTRPGSPWVRAQSSPPAAPSSGRLASGLHCSSS